MRIEIRNTEEVHGYIATAKGEIKIYKGEKMMLKSTKLRLEAIEAEVKRLACKHESTEFFAHKDILWHDIFGNASWSFCYYYGSEECRSCGHVLRTFKTELEYCEAIAERRAQQMTFAMKRIEELKDEEKHRTYQSSSDE